VRKRPCKSVCTTASRCQWRGRRVRRRGTCAAARSQHQPPCRLQQHSILESLLRTPASCTSPAPGSKTDARASSIMHNGLASSNITPHWLTTATTIATARRSSSPAGSSQALPASSQHRAPRPLQIQPMSGLRSETAQNQLPEHTHASQNHSRSQPQQIGGTSKWRRTLVRRRSSRSFTRGRFQRARKSNIRLSFYVYMCGTVTCCDRCRLTISTGPVVSISFPNASEPIRHTGPVHMPRSTFP
jgi:hypothetical protein